MRWSSGVAEIVYWVSTKFSSLLVLWKWRRTERTVARRSQFYWPSWAQGEIYWSSSHWYSTTTSLCYKTSNTYVQWSWIWCALIGLLDWNAESNDPQKTNPWVWRLRFQRSFIHSCEMQHKDVFGRYGKDKDEDNLVVTTIQPVSHMK